MKPSKTINPAPKKRPAPLSVRLSEEQRTQLKQMAGNMTVNAYIIMRLFGEDATKKRARRITQDILLLSPPSLVNPVCTLTCIHLLNLPNMVHCMSRQRYKNNLLSPAQMSPA